MTCRITNDPPSQRLPALRASADPMTIHPAPPVPVSDNGAYQPSGAAALASTAPANVVLAAWLDAAMDSPHTRRAYGRHVRTAIAAMGCWTLAGIIGAGLAQHRARIMAAPLSHASQAQALAALRSFLTWAGTMGAHRLPADVIATALRIASADVRRPYVVLSDPELAALLQAADSPRDRALVAVLAGAGLRAAEAVGLDVQDVLEDGDGQHALNVAEGKGRRSRVVPIQPDLANLIRTFLCSTNRTLADDGPIFRAHDFYAARRPRQRLTSRSVGHVVARSAARAGIHAKRVTPHSLRHSFAIRALRHHGNVMAVSKLLGHRSVATTQRYLDHLAVAELRDAVPLLPEREPHVSTGTTPRGTPQVPSVDGLRALRTDRGAQPRSTVRGTAAAPTRGLARTRAGR